MFQLRQFGQVAQNLKLNHQHQKRLRLDRPTSDHLEASVQLQRHLSQVGPSAFCSLAGQFGEPSPDQGEEEEEEEEEELVEEEEEEVEEEEEEFGEPEGVEAEHQGDTEEEDCGVDEEFLLESVSPPPPLSGRTKQLDSFKRPQARLFATSSQDGQAKR